MASKFVVVVLFIALATLSEAILYLCCQFDFGAALGQEFVKSGQFYNPIDHNLKTQWQMGPVQN